MGIIARQSIKNFFWSNWGFLLGAFYTFILIPKVFHDNPSQWGLLQILVYYNQVLLPVALISLPTVIIKYFPEFKNNSKHYELLSASITIILSMLGIVSVLFLFLGKFLGPKQSSQDLFNSYYFIVIIILLFSTLFEILAAWSKVCLKSTVPNFLKDSFIKSWNFVIILVYYFELISFDLLIWIYFGAYFIQLLIMVIYIYSFDQLKIRLGFRIVKNIFNKQHYIFIIFSVFGTAAYTILNKIDILMISKMLDLEQVAYYTIALAVIAFIQLPEKSISAISIPSLSLMINKNDINEIEDLYKKTSLTQLILSTFIFLGIWLNIDSISSYLGEKFGNIKYVILFLGLAKLVDVTTGLNGPLISISKYYKYAFGLQFLLVIFLIISNLLFIPKYGINGAAFASFISISVYNILKTLFVYSKFKIWPFNIKTIYSLIIILISYFTIVYMPILANFWINFIFRSVLFTVVYISLFIGFNISEDLNRIFKIVLTSFKIIKQKQ